MISKFLKKLIRFSDGETIHCFPRLTFITRILVPETAMLLIAEDLGIGGDEALRVLHESQAYGLHHFPDNCDESEEEGAVKWMSNKAWGKQRESDVLPQYLPCAANEKGKNRVLEMTASVDEEMTLVSVSDSDSFFN